MKNKNSYKLNKNYNELFEQLSKGELIIAYAENTQGSDEPFKDIFKLTYSEGVIKGINRNTSYITISEFEAQIKKTDIKDLFVTECQAYDLTWITP